MAVAAPSPHGHHHHTFGLEKPERDGNMKGRRAGAGEQRGRCRGLGGSRRRQGSGAEAREVVEETIDDAEEAQATRGSSQSRGGVGIASLRLIESRARCM